jgi:polysaccharide deacetylase family protein (PEP-CTERM system associated)
MIQRIVKAGHELASHGYSHIRVTQQTPEAFYEDITRTKALLEDLGGVPVLGYRSASYSIGAANLWALECLHRAGYVYSSSIYPIRHDFGGMPESPRFAFHPKEAEELLEIPVTTVEILNRKFPCGGGGYFRLLPYAISRWAIRRVNKFDNRACVFYFHPWEIDPHQPRQSGIDLKTRVRHYLNLTRMEHRLKRLLKDFDWDRMDRIFLPKREAVLGDRSLSTSPEWNRSKNLSSALP